jgi:hypothetical protein
MIVEAAEFSIQEIKDMISDITYYKLIDEFVANNVIMELLLKESLLRSG